MRKKRHLSFRPLLEGFAMIGEYMVLEAKAFFFTNLSCNFLFLMNILYKFVIYFSILSLFLIINSFLFGSKLIFFNMEKGLLLYKKRIIKKILKSYWYIALTCTLKKNYKKTYGL
jgi:hypothetical protein